MTERGLPIPPRPMSKRKKFSLGVLCVLLLGLLVVLIIGYSKAQIIR